MPTVSRSDCTQVDLTETIKIAYDSLATVSPFKGKITSVDVDFNACRGINNRNNDLWAYMAKLYYQGDISAEQFGEAGRIITNDGCEEAVKYQLNKQNLKTGLVHNAEVWTKVAGRDGLNDGLPFGKNTFYISMFEHSSTAPSDPSAEVLDNTPILLRACAGCVKTHKYIYYRRLTSIANGDFDLLYNLIYERSNGGGDNVWTEDFTLHSTYEDALTGANPWLCPGDAYNYGDGFPGQCSPTGARVKDQGSIFHWSSGTQLDVAWYVNKPESEGIQTFNANTRSGSFTDVDVGTVGATGRTMVTTIDGEDNYHISVASGDIWNQADNFHYLAQSKSGDIDVSVNVASFTNIATVWAKAGIMLRADNSPNAQYLMATLTGGRGVTLYGRTSRGNWATEFGSRYQENPVQTSAWLRLVKKMDLVEMYRSDDGVEWTLHASANIFFPNDTFRVGLAVTSNNMGTTSEATFEDYQINEYFFPTSSPSISSAPTVWEPAVDVGDVQRAGSITEPNADGVARVYGSGTGTWGHNDAFFFHNVQKSVGGALEVTVHVNNFSYHYQYGKGGIMIRDSNDPDAANAFIAIAGRNQGVIFQSREEAGAVTTHHSFHWVQNNDVWLKLTKEADSSVVTASYKHSSDTEWTVAGATSLMLTGETVQVGLAVTAGDAYQHALAQLDYKEYDVVES